MISKKHSLSQRGFTLVELLIVIVIIGILAGVVIGVLNPVQQQNRAKDAGIRAQIDKMALSTKSLYVSSPRVSNKAPTGAEFFGGLANAVQSSSPCTGTDPAAAAGTCYVTLTGVGLPATCAGLYNGTGGTTPCNFAYYRTPDGATSMFRLAARGWATPERLFVYSYSETLADGTVSEGFYSCAANFDITSGAVSGCDPLN